jgi:hypothetical protein
MEQQMSQGLQAWFFIAVIFLFGFGASILIYKNYNEFYQDQIKTSNEISSIPPVKIQEKISPTTTSPLLRFIND